MGGGGGGGGGGVAILPKAHQSTALLCPLDWMISGARYSGVPHSVHVLPRSNKTTNMIKNLKPTRHVIELTGNGERGREEEEFISGEKNIVYITFFDTFLIFYDSLLQNED